MLPSSNHAVTRTRFTATLAALVAVIASLLVAPAAHAAAPIEITGTVYRDLDASGTLTPGDTPITALPVQLLDAANTVVASTSTGGTGVYSFDRDVAGTYTVRITYPANYFATAGAVDGPGRTYGDIPVTVVPGTQQVFPVFLRPDAVLDVDYVAPGVADGTGPFSAPGANGCTTVTSVADPGYDCGPNNGQVRTNDIVSFPYSVSLNSASGATGSVDNVVMTHVIGEVNGANARFTAIPLRCTPAGGGGSSPASVITYNPVTGVSTLRCNLGTLTFGQLVFFNAGVLVSGTSAVGSSFTSVVTATSTGTGTLPVALPDTAPPVGPFAISSVPEFDAIKSYTPATNPASFEMYNGVLTAGRSLSFFIQINSTHGALGSAGLSNPFSFNDQITLLTTGGTVLPSSAYKITSCVPTGVAGRPRAGIIFGVGATADGAQAGTCAFTGGVQAPATLTITGANTTPATFPTIDTAGNPLPASTRGLVTSHTVTVWVPNSEISALSGGSNSILVRNCVADFDPTSAPGTGGAGGVSNYGAATEPVANNCGQGTLTAATPVVGSMAFGKTYYGSPNRNAAVGGSSVVGDGNGTVGRGATLHPHLFVNHSGGLNYNPAICDIIDTQTQIVVNSPSDLPVVPAGWVMEFSTAAPTSILSHQGTFNPATNRWELDLTDGSFAAYRSTTCGNPLNWADGTDGPWYSSITSVPAGETISRVRLRLLDPTVPLNGVVGVSADFPVQVRTTYNGGPLNGQQIPDGQILPDVATYTADNGAWIASTYNPNAHSGALGDRVTVQDVKLVLDKLSIAPAEIVGTPVWPAGQPVVWEMRTTVTGLSGVQAVARQVQLVDDLPAGVTYDPACTALQGLALPTTVGVSPSNPARTRLTWQFGDLATSVTPYSVRVCVSTDPATPNNTDIVNNAVVSSIDDRSAPGTTGITPQNRQDSDTVRLQQLGGFQLYKSVDGFVDATNDEQVYTMRWLNSSTQTSLLAPTFIDVLPYNGDGTAASGSQRSPGSTYTGTLQLTVAPSANRAGLLTYTADAPNSVNQVPFQNTSNWCSLSGTTFTFASGPGSQADCPASLASVTAFRYQQATALASFDPANSTTSGGDRGLITFTLQAGFDGQAGQASNRPGDRYVNRYAGQTPSLSASSFLLSNTTAVTVVGFEVGDLLFEDTDDDGHYTAGTDIPAPAGVVVHLLDAAGTPVTDPATGTPITTMTTAGGRYLFSAVLSGTYRVSFGTSEFAAAGLMPGARPFIDEADPAAGANENLDAHGVLSGASVMSGPFTLSFDATTGNGNAPLGDAVAGGPPTTQPDSYTNLTIDLRYRSAPEVGIVTEAASQGALGNAISDVITVSGLNGRSATVDWTLFGPVAPIAGSCSAVDWSAAPTAGSGSSAVNGDGTVVTPTTTVTAAGCYSFGVIASGSNVNTVSPVGLPEETVLVDGYEPAISTAAVASSGYVGAQVHDTVDVTGLPPGFTADYTWTLLGPVAPIGGSCAAVDWTGAPTLSTGIVASGGLAEVTTPAVDVVEPGCYTYTGSIPATPFSSAVTAPPGDPLETVLIKPIVPTLSTVISSSAVGDGFDLTDRVEITGLQGSTATLTWTVLGPVAATAGSCAVVDWATAAVLGTGILVITADGPAVTPAVTAPSTGCYTYVQVLSGALFDDVVSAAGIPSETVNVAAYAPTIVTQISDVTGSPGITLTDAVTIAGASPTDVSATMTWTLLGPVDAVEGSCLALDWSDAAVEATGTLVITGNGTLTTPAVVVDDPGCFTYIEALEGDTFSLPVATLPGDPSETVLLTPFTPTVDTVIQADSAAGYALWDQVVIGNLRGSTGTLEWTLLGPVAAIAGSCAAVDWSDAAVVETGTMTVMGDSTVLTPRVAVEGYGCFTYVQQLSGRNFPTAISLAGLPSETVLRTRPVVSQGDSGSSLALTGLTSVGGLLGAGGLFLAAGLALLLLRRRRRSSRI